MEFRPFASPAVCTRHYLFTWGLYLNVLCFYSPCPQTLASTSPGMWITGYQHRDKMLFQGKGGGGRSSFTLPRSLCQIRAACHSERVEGLKTAGEISALYTEPVSSNSILSPSQYPKTNEIFLIALSVLE